jgi:hypothetical protein
LPDSASSEDVVWNANIASVDASGNGEAQIRTGRAGCFLVPGMGHEVNHWLTGQYALRTKDLGDVRKHVTECGISISNFEE